MNTQRELYCPLTPFELSERSAELAGVIQKQAEIEAEKKSVMSNFADRLNKIIMDSRIFARIVAEKRERRMIECKWEYDYSRNVKTLIRLDTGEMVEESVLSENEKKIPLPLGEV